MVGDALTNPGNPTHTGAVASKFAQAPSMKLNLDVLGKKNLQRISFVGEKLGLVPKRSKSTALKEVKHFSHTKTKAQICSHDTLCKISSILRSY